MEKGFNDDELADIMNEIESLEEEFSEEEAFEKEFAREAATSKKEPTPSDETKKIEAQHVEHKVEPQYIEARHAKTEHTEPEGFEEETVVAAASSKPRPDTTMVVEEAKEVLTELAQMPVEDIAPTAKAEVEQHEEDDNIHHLKFAPRQEKQTDSGHTAMSFHVEGDMRFELSFHVGGKFVGLTVTEEGLEIGLDGGAKFTVPLEQHVGSGSGVDKKAI